MLAITNAVPLPDYSYLLKDYDGDAVIISDANLKHLGDTIVRLQKIIKEEQRLLNKTHSADNILSTYRSLSSAYQQRKQYYSETYKNKKDE